ncbi:MAG: hypothetical protein Q7J44_20150 [Pseudotabrizicola sp.]|uniref:hypothetical protein n=1 Tax=Pseudotabrizicola sp. TaxID=2939647 RepID=UPI002723D53E|nr:hypothetical protein [Pseudotabrizicola sp.]MDO9640850.1 hypothetical protein [Pseudotabrizicola sp.]
MTLTPISASLSPVLIAAVCPGLGQSVVAAGAGVPSHSGARGVLAALEADAAKTETLAAIQPGQRERRRALFLRLAALRLAGWPVPRYEGLQISAAARQNPLRRNLKDFAGMQRRALRA